MNRSDLITLLAERKKLPHRRAQRVVEEVFGAISQALILGERVEFRGLGSWEAKLYRAREGRNPKTGEPISVPERRLLFFSAGKDIHERLNRANHEPSSS